MYGNEGSLASVGAPEIRTTEVQAEISRISEGAAYLDKCIGELETKLSPVLAQHKVGSTDGQAAPTPLRVPLAEVLHTYGDTMEDLRLRVSSIISRLEL